jgi:hypothetical protein
MSGSMHLYINPLFFFFFKFFLTDKTHESQTFISILPIRSKQEDHDWIIFLILVAKQRRERAYCGAELEGGA